MKIFWMTILIMITVAYLVSLTIVIIYLDVHPLAVLGLVILGELTPLIIIGLSMYTIEVNVNKSRRKRRAENANYYSWLCGLGLFDTIEITRRKRIKDDTSWFS